ncbi:MAG: hypothetical protein K0Q92_2890, partial [Steroidobacteraceae bacterium]|nr:hypothetical protein [Steroidobacteraceae bacterium]
MIRVFLLVAVALMAFVTPAAGQVPTAEQLEMLRSMSPEDRAALMETLGVSDVPGSDPAPERERTTDAAQRDRRASERRLPVDAEMDKRLKGDDSLLVDLQFKRDKPPRMEERGQGLPPIAIPGEPAPELTPEEETSLQSLIDLVRSRNPYQLDSNGALALPGFPPIVLAGLDEEQATKRLAAVTAFGKLDVKVMRLPVRKIGVSGLKPFGYELFNDSPSTFAPLTEVPVPSDYIVGPGDQINVLLFGSQNRTLRLVVSRDGRINFPELGPIQVSGRAFARVASELEQRVSDQMIGVRASVTMGDTRSIRILVMGEANRPGSYTVSGLSTITSALYAAGGVKTIGSLRDVQLKRRGEVVRRLDLYELLLRGDTSDDANLLPGDVIFIPPVSVTVAVDGEVNRPAIYEIKAGTSVDDIIQLAGGLTNEADGTRVALVRVNEQRQRVVVDVALDDASARGQLLRRGDSLRVLRLRPTIDSGVTLEGHMFRPGLVAWREGMRLTDAIGSVDELRPNADINYVLIRREMAPDRRAVMLSADLAAALREPNSPRNVELEPRDRIIVFDSESGREQLLNPLLDEMRRQSRFDRPSEIVRIDGRVKARGDYPLEPGMRISDLLRAGGGLQDAAYATQAELTRY